MRRGVRARGPKTKREWKKMARKIHNLLLGGILVLDAAVDEGSQGSGGLLGLSGVLAHGELGHQLVQHLEGLSVLLGGHLGGVRRETCGVEVEKRCRVDSIGLGRETRRTFTAPRLIVYP